jgi:uridine phosphorylase
LALGKAEAKDKFEEIKKEFSVQVGALKNLIETTSEKSLSPDVRAKIEALEVQLALGKAESKDHFEEQKKKIVKAITNVEEEIRKSWKKIQSPNFFVHEAENFKLKLEILRLRFGLKKFEMKADYRASMEAARREIEKLASGTKESLHKGKEKYDDFKDEISLAYKHLKKAVESLT